MANVINLIFLCIAVVIAITLVPTIWDAVWVDSAATPGGSQVNGSTWTLLKLVPLVFVGVLIIGGALFFLR